LDVRFYVDDSGEPHIATHGVSESEVIEVLEAAREDRGGPNGSRIALGQTESGRYLRVIYVEEPTGDVFVLTAYELGNKPLRAYRRRRRRKG
jgi:hypothetical protein